MFATKTLRRSLALGGAALVGPALLLGATPTASAESGSSTSGSMVLDCVLEPFSSAFRFEGEVTVTAIPDGQGGIALKSELPDMPGIAPVEIVGGQMHSNLKLQVAGDDVELTGTTEVNVPAKADVPIQALEGSLVTDKGYGVVQVSGYEFAFDPLMGLEITAECETAKPIALGSIGFTPEAANAVAEGNTEDVELAAAESSGDDGAMGLFTLGGVSAVVLVAGLVVAFLRRRRGAGGVV